MFDSLTLINLTFAQMTFDPSSINVDEMTIAEIESLLPQLSIELENAKLSKPIHEEVDEEFSKTWDTLVVRYNQEFDKFLEVEKSNFTFKRGLGIVLERAIGPFYVKQFFESVDECIRARDFTKRSRFLRKVDSEDTLEVLKVGFAIYRLHISSSPTGRRLSPVGTSKKHVKADISGFKKSHNKKVQEVLTISEKIGILPS